MDNLELKVNTRQVLGKKVRFLRREGITPVHVFGHNIESLSLQSDTVSLQRVLSQAGKTRLINLMLDKAKKPRNVIAREVQKDPITGRLLHVDLYEVSMKEKITCEIPIKLIGEAPALKLKENMLSQELDILDIECLPGSIPQSIEVDISSLAEAGQSIRIKDLKLGEDIEINNNPDVVIARISTAREEVVEAPVAEAAAAATGEVPTVGAGKKEEAGGEPKAEKGKAEKPKAEKPGKDKA